MSAESESKADAKSGKKLPVTVITGFLGAGKTTLLQYILNNKDHGMKVALINNEFVASTLVKIGVQSEMKLSGEGSGSVVASADIMETASGCLCCGGGAQDFTRILWQLSAHKDSVDYVLVETTGMADPNFTQAFFLDERLKTHFFLDGIVCLADAKNLPAQLARTPADDGEQKKQGLTVINEAVEQLAVADRIILNKTDTVKGAGDLAAVEALIRKINPVAPITRTQFSRVPDLDAVLGIKAFSLETALKRDKGFLDFRPHRVHDKAIEPLSLCGDGVVSSVAAFEGWLRGVLKERGSDILRCKGIIDVKGSEDLYVFQGVHDMLDISPRPGLRRELHPKKAAGPEHRESMQVPLNRIVFIGRGVLAAAEELVESFEEAVNTADLAEEERVRLAIFRGDEGQEIPAGQKLLLLAFALFLAFRMKALAWLVENPVVGVVVALVFAAFCLWAFRPKSGARSKRKAGSGKGKTKTA